MKKQIVNDEMMDYVYAFTTKMHGVCISREKLQKYVELGIWVAKLKTIANFWLGEVNLSIRYYPAASGSPECNLRVSVLFPSESCSVYVHNDGKIGIEILAETL